MTPVSSDPICEASRIRCDSPPDKDGPGRSSVRYPRPTSSRKRSRLPISFNSSAATTLSLPVSGSLPTNSIAWSMVIRETATMLLPGVSPTSPTVTARLSGRSRSPLQAEHALSLK